VDSNGDRSSFQKETRCLYENGILYTSNGHKGQALLQLLKAKNFKPAQVILFDDKKYNVEQMADTCKENNINFLGFEYLAATAAKL
ncbi:MAG TPA: DUF2608 domain-containing protein, partial [Candidatus Berkiella sp.]|nr:DUF2608 domain-containing protein [Candidatus Berkiella sp.]